MSAQYQTSRPIVSSIIASFRSSSLLVTKYHISRYHITKYQITKYRQDSRIDSDKKYFTVSQFESITQINTKLEVVYSN